MNKRENFFGPPPSGRKQVLVTGVNGTIVSYPLVKVKLDIPLNPYQQPRKHELILGNANTLGMDILKGKEGIIGGERWAFGAGCKPSTAILEEGKVPLYSVRLLAQAPALPPSAVTHVKQYNVPAEAIAPVTELIKDLETRGVLIRTHSPYNSPVWPVKKPNGKWRLTIDYRKLNSNTGPLTAAVPNIASIVNTIQTWNKQWLAVLDIKDMFFMVPLQPADQNRFAFTWKGVQYTFTRMPQGFKHSPTICHGALSKVLDGLTMPPSIQMLQYIDDILIGGDTTEEVQQAVDLVKTALENLGLALPPDKCQGPSHEVKFLGAVWMGGRRSVPDDTVQELSQAPSPGDKSQLRQTLGVLGFWRKHVPGFAVIARPLYNLLKKSAVWEWTPVHEEALRQLINEIHTYQALGPIHPDAPFHVYLTIGATGMSYALWQESETAPRRPIQFGSKSWQGSQANYTPYEKVLLAAYTALRETEELTQNRAITIHTPLPIIKPILEGKELPPGVAQKMTTQKWALYIHYRVGGADSAQNPTMIKESLWRVGMPNEYHLPPQPSPIQNAAAFDPSHPEGVWFTDGSAKLIKGRWKGKAAAVPADNSTTPLTTDVDGSAQLAELAAIKLACEAGA
uniref:ribonuclease H n=1 Tax=Pelodiscus sinensis TaxID=13735 RepID=K7EZ27_PELSI